jgi:hypothetical protein
VHAVQVHVVPPLLEQVQRTGHIQLDGVVLPELQVLAFRHVLAAHAQPACICVEHGLLDLNLNAHLDDVGGDAPCVCAYANSHR